MTEDTLQRDERLASALRELPVAEHADDFWIGLDERLLDDRRARRAVQQASDDAERQAAGPPMAVLSSGRARPPGSPGARRPPGSGPPGTGTPARSRRPYTQDPGSIVLELARHATDITPHRRGPSYPRHFGRFGRLGLIAAVAVFAVIAIVAVALVFGGEPDDEEAAAVAATTAIADVAEAMSSPISLSGGLTITEFTAQTGVPEPVGRTYTFVWRVDGSYRYTLADGTFDEAYDAQLGTRRKVQVAPGFGSVVEDQTNVAPGPPDGVAPALPVANAMMTVFRAVLADPSGATVTEETRDDQDVMVVDTPLNPIGTDPAPDRARLAVDPDSKLPIAVSFLIGGQPWEDIRVDNLAVDAPLGAENFVVAVPGSPRLTPSDGGFRRVASPAEATAAVGYAASVPAFIPSGFKLAEVAVSAEAQSPGATNPDGTQAPAQVANGVAFLSYRRGFEQMVVTTRRGVTPLSDRWTDPFGTTPGVEGRAIELESGRFDGVTASSIQTPPAMPHLWGATDELVFTVSGILTADELTRVANSLD
jgi:hypothetical protein